MPKKLVFALAATAVMAHGFLGMTTHYPVGIFSTDNGQIQEPIKSKLRIRRFVLFQNRKNTIISPSSSSGLSDQPAVLSDSENKIMETPKEFSSAAAHVLEEERLLGRLGGTSHDTLNLFSVPGGESIASELSEIYIDAKTDYGNPNPVNALVEIITGAHTPALSNAAADKLMELVEFTPPEHTNHAARAIAELLPGLDEPAKVLRTLHEAAKSDKKIVKWLFPLLRYYDTYWTGLPYGTLTHEVSLSIANILYDPELVWYE